jgi:hypothetical protein
MAMDPKQERALRDGTASKADQPRETDIESVREQAEKPPVSERPRPRRRTAAVADVRVNQEAGTPVDQMAREIGAEPVPEMGRAPRNKRNGEDPGGREEPDRAEAEPGAPREFQPTTDPQLAAPVTPREARRTLKARREHSKGDGNFPAPEPSPKLIDERPEDREPRDVPKSRDDRSAPKGNITAGQDDRNPNLETADDQRPGPPSRAFSLDAARDAAAMPNAAPRARPIAEAKRAEKPKAERAPSMPKPKTRTVAKRTGPRPRAQERTRAGSARGATKRAKPKRAMTKRAAPKRSAVKRAAPRKRTGAKRPATRAKRKR